jgi:hypothetical protein
MRIEVRQREEPPLLCFDDEGRPVEPPSSDCTVWDLDAAREITYCVAADDRTGEYERFVIDEKGDATLDAQNNIVRERGRVSRLGFRWLTGEQAKK